MLTKVQRRKLYELQLSLILYDYLKLLITHSFVDNAYSRINLLTYGSANRFEGGNTLSCVRWSQPSHLSLKHRGYISCPSHYLFQCMYTLYTKKDVLSILIVCNLKIFLNFLKFNKVYVHW